MPIGGYNNNNAFSNFLTQSQTTYQNYALNRRSREVSRAPVLQQARNQQMTRGSSNAAVSAKLQAVVAQSTAPMPQPIQAREVVVTASVPIAPALSLLQPTSTALTQTTHPTQLVPAEPERASGPRRLFRALLSCTKAEERQDGD